MKIFTTNKPKPEKTDWTEVKEKKGARFLEFRNKFVLMKKGDEFLVYIFLDTSSKKHNEVVKDFISAECVFVGAGVIEEGIEKIYFHSSSCNAEYGYCEPDDLNQSQQLLAEIERAVKELL